MSEITKIQAQVKNQDRYNLYLDGEYCCSLSKFVVLKNRLSGIIDAEKDSVRYYFMGNNWNNRIEMVGKETSYDVTSELII